MVELVFPSSPAAGELFPDPALPNVSQWSWDGGRWNLVGGAGAIGDAPSDGELYGRRNGVWESVPVPVPPPDVSIVPLGGFLRIVGASPSSQIGFFPKNGGWVRINGENYPIPAIGVFANATNVYVDGVGGRILEVQTLYRVYLFDNDGELTIDFSTTEHEASAAPGNIGVEIKQGDDTRSLVGIIYSGASPDSSATIPFVDQNNYRCVRSWFNRPNTVVKPELANWTLASLTPSQGAYPTNAVCYFVTFSEAALLIGAGSGSSNVAANTMTIYGQIDEAGGGISQYFATAGVLQAFTLGDSHDLPEDFHTYQLYGYNSVVSTITATMALTITILGS